MRSVGAVRTVAELVMLGYPLPLLKRVVGGITQKPVRGLRGTALRYLRALRRKYRDQLPPGEEVREDLHDMHVRGPLVSTRGAAVAVACPFEQCCVGCCCGFVLCNQCSLNV